VDKSAAFESYAKQADDEELLNNARRIKVRAIDRMGELLDEVPRREAKQVRGKVVSLGTLLFRAPKSPAPLGFRQPSKSPQHVFIVSRAIPSSNESPARKPSRPHWHAISKGVCWRMRSWRGSLRSHDRGEKRPD
jgi:hypothetical protein